MSIKIENTERGLHITIVALLAIAVFGPEVTQPIHQHNFADQRFLDICLVQLM